MPNVLSKVEQAQLLEAVARLGKPRDRAILSLALGTGLRLSTRTMVAYTTPSGGELYSAISPL